jgi:hypothetical protein
MALSWNNFLLPRELLRLRSKGLESIEIAASAPDIPPPLYRKSVPLISPSTDTPGGHPSIEQELVLDSKNISQAFSVIV